MKRCSKCKTIKTLGDFYSDRSRSDGLDTRCRDCVKQREALRYSQNRDEIIRRATAWKHKHPKAHALHGKQWRTRHPKEQRAQHVLRRVREKTARGSFTGEQWNLLCAKYGNICLCCGQRKPLTVDHIVPLSQGGDNMIGNIQPLCSDCNTRKSTKIIDYRQRSRVYVEQLSFF